MNPAFTTLTSHRLRRTLLLYNVILQLQPAPVGGEDNLSC